MKRLIAIVVTIFCVTLAVHSIFPKYTLYSVQSGLVKFDRLTGKSWRLNLVEGLWYEMGTVSLKEQEGQEKEEPEQAE